MRHLEDLRECGITGWHLAESVVCGLVIAALIVFGFLA